MGKSKLERIAVVGESASDARRFMPVPQVDELIHYFSKEEWDKIPAKDRKKDYDRVVEGGVDYESTQYQRDPDDYNEDGTINFDRVDDDDEDQSEDNPDQTPE